MKHSTLVLAVFLAVCVFWSYGYSNEEFLKDVICISESGDNNLCNDLQDCIKQAPQCYMLPYYYCMRKVLPDGPGKCSKSEQAYGSEDNLNKIDECYLEITTLPNGDDWTTFPEFNTFLDCVQDIGDKCKSRGSSESGSSGSKESGSSGSSEDSK
ncbi:unnamed protein product [Larinioides sclopetarius]|uniref:Uncharacterized protein n=1 Tax=Larinioides sclopetarius TaxID=280406 RepID=A0AAV1ZNP4_9ARAC